MSRRDAVGFRIFYFETSRAIVRYARLLDPEHGNDLAAEAFTRALERWSDVSGFERPEAWVRKVVLNLHITNLRRQRLESLFCPRDVAQRDLSSNVSDRVTLEAALGGLTPRQRAAVILRYYEGLTFKEVAAAMGCTVSTANRHIHRGLAKLRLAIDVSTRDDVPSNLLHSQTG
jgi:RNA polymerase sigma factor (sigma-70 family)